MDLLDTQVYGLIGDEGFHRLVAAFYRQVPDDPILAPLYPRLDLAGAETRLRSFLIMRFGGPQDYLQQRGHPRLRMRHARFAIDQSARDRWIELMENAMSQSDLPPQARGMLRKFFHDAATFLINRPGKTDSVPRE